jgi:AbrB family looped-hinge helix DNA binding protein
MDVAAKLTSKGQITVPKSVRDTLALKPGDQVLFRVEDNRAILARTEDFLGLAGAVAVPPGKRGMRWEEIRRQTRQARFGGRS